jgi:hypothetical protein
VCLYEAECHLAQRHGLCRRGSKVSKATVCFYEAECNLTQRHGFCRRGSKLSKASVSLYEAECHLAQRHGVCCRGSKLSKATVSLYEAQCRVCYRGRLHWPFTGCIVIYTFPTPELLFPAVTLHKCMLHEYGSTVSHTKVCRYSRMCVRVRGAYCREALELSENQYSIDSCVSVNTGVVLCYARGH